MVGMHGMREIRKLESAGDTSVLSRQWERLGEFQSSSRESPIETAYALRDATIEKSGQLAVSEKVRLLMIINKIKVRAMLREDEQSRRLFRILEKTGHDLLKVF